jgi:cobalt/nickel transport system permease protein
MHMADALLSPTVGGTMWATAAGTIIYSANKLKQEMDDRRVPLMGVLAAFVFAAQMINFTIPGTGSSGHLGGGLLLAVLLGPHAALLTISSVLTVQALFFADGGLLALGANIFNMGILPCFIAYPLIFKRIVAGRPGRGRLLTASLVAAVVGLQLGALGVVLETTLSGITDLPFFSFAMLMQPIHLAIGIVEGLVTAGVISFIRQMQPELLDNFLSARPAFRTVLPKVLITLLFVAVVTGGWLSWFASERPDGLEWSVAGMIGTEEVAAPPDTVHATLKGLQEKSSLMPDYGFKHSAPDAAAGSAHAATSAAGLLGGLLTLALSLAVGFFLKRRRPDRR